MIYFYCDFKLQKEIDGSDMYDWIRVYHVLNPFFCHMAKESPFGIFKTDCKHFVELKQYPYIEEVPLEVYRLLDSSTEYLPAFSLARAEIHKSDLRETITKEEFNEIILKVFRKYLERQWQDRYILAEVVIPKVPDLIEGHFHWVLNYTPKIKVVSYINQFNFIDSDHVACFKLTEQQIKQLPVLERKSYLISDRKNRRSAEFDLTDESLDFDEISEMIKQIR